MKGRSRTRNRGTTLVELIVTIVFLSICVVPMLTMVNTTQLRANDSKARMVALAVAQDELDKQKVQAKKVPPVPGLLTAVLNNVNGLLHSANVKTTINAGGVPKLYNITVEVEYDDSGSKVVLSSKIKGA